MVKKLIVLGVLFTVLCFTGVGCYRGGARVEVGESPYYDGPYTIGGDSYYYYNGGFYNHDGGAFRFHHYVPQGERGSYEESHRYNREQYNRDYPKWRDQHPGHPHANREKEKDRR